MDIRYARRLEETIREVGLLRTEVDDIKQAVAQLIMTLAKLERTLEGTTRNGADRQRRTAGSN